MSDAERMSDSIASGSYLRFDDPKSLSPSRSFRGLGTLKISHHFLPQPAGVIDQALVHPDLSGRRPLRLFHDRLQLLASPNLTISLPRAEEYVDKLLVVPLQACGIPRAPIGYPADMEAATEDSGGEVAVGRGHGFTRGVR